MGKSPTEIKQEIEQTREEMAETVDALEYKMDVKGRAKERVRDMASAPKDAILRVKESVTGRVEEVAPDPRQVKRASRRFVKSSKRKFVRTADSAKANPAGLVAGGVALGILAGLAAPKTRIEDERIGPIVDDLKDSVKEAGHEAIEQGKQVAQQATAAAVDTVQTEGLSAAQHLVGSVRGEEEGGGEEPQEPPSRTNVHRQGSYPGY